MNGQKFGIKTNQTQMRDGAKGKRVTVLEGR